jgi:hypothetical protein
MTTRILALLCAFVMLSPAVSTATSYQAFFPGGANFAMEIDAPAVDAIHHQLLGISGVNLDLFAVLMLTGGTPSAPSGRPWLYGQVSAVQQLGPNTFRVTWTVSTSTKGVVFTPVGTIMITFVV